MALPASTSKIPRKRRWIRRVFFIAAGFAVAAIASPFIFTGMMVRYWLAHSSYRDLPLRFEKASLSPTGRLTLYHVAIDDSAEQYGLPLLTADKAEIAFRWADISSGRLQQLALEKLDVTLRPGKETPITLLRLLTPPGASPPALAAATSTAPTSSPAPPPAQNGPSLWIDQILVTGVFRLEGYGAHMAASPFAESQPIPLDLMITSSGASSNWNGTLAVVAGNASPDTPRLSGRLSLTSSPDVTTINLESFSLERFPGTLSPDALPIRDQLPEWARQNLSWRVDSLSLAGSATFGKDNALSMTLELRDLNARAATSDLPIVLDHFAAGMHAEGKITATPLTDLNFSRMRCAWDAIHVATSKFTKGVADFAVEGDEIELTDLQTTTTGTEIIATAALNTKTGLVTRGRLWLNDFSAPDLITHLPEEARRSIPWALQGTLSARVFLTESDADHYAGFVEVLCPDRLIALQPPRASPAAQTGPQPVLPWATVTSLDLSGTVSWRRRADARPEISGGRLTADQWLIVSPQAGDPEIGVPLTRIKSDFTLTADKFFLNDFYADLPGNGRIAAEAEYIFTARSLAKSSLDLSGVDAALVNAWLPAGWTLSGQIDTDVQFSYSATAAKCDLSLGLSPQTTLKSADGMLSLTGASLPAFTGHASLNRRTEIWTVQASELTNIGALQADAPMLVAVRKMVTPSGGGPLDSLLTRIAAGGFVSLDKFTFAGTIDPVHSRAAGKLILGGIDLGRETDKPLLQNLTFNGTVALPLSAAASDAVPLQISDAEIFAEKISLGQNVMTEILAAISAGNGKASLPRVKFKFAEGTIEGEAAGLLNGQLDALHLTLTSLNQQILTRSLYPDVFTAEGLVSGKLTLDRSAAGLTGGIVLVGDNPGRLKISRDTTKQYIAPLAQSAADAQGATLPKNFGEIVTDQLADYPYVTERVIMQDAPGRVNIKLDYTRQPLQPGDPGYAAPVTIAGQEYRANLEFQLRNSISVNSSIADLLRNTLGFRDSLVAPPSTTSSPPTRP